MPLKRLPEDLSQVSSEELDTINWDEYEPEELDRMLEHSEKSSKDVAKEIAVHEQNQINREVAQEAKQRLQRQQLHKQQVGRLQRTGLGILAGTALAGGALYGGKKLYDYMQNKHAENQPLSEQDITTIRLLAMTPEERILHQRMNPAGLLALHAEPEEPKIAGAVGDFFRKNILRRSPEYIKKRNEIAVAGKALNEKKLLEETARRHGLLEQSSKTAPEPSKGFLERNKYKLLGGGALAAGGAYMYDQAQQQALQPSYKFAGPREDKFIEDVLNNEELQRLLDEKIRKNPFLKRFHDELGKRTSKDYERIEAERSAARAEREEAEFQKGQKGRDEALKKELEAYDAKKAREQRLADLQKNLDKVNKEDTVGREYEARSERAAKPVAEPVSTPKPIKAKAKPQPIKSESKPRPVKVPKNVVSPGRSLKWPLLGAGLLGATGLAYGGKKMYDYFNNTSKTAANLPAKMPPIPFKAKSQAARQGKPFFTPSQAEHAKKMEGPAASKAPWEEKTSAFREGYMQVLDFLKVAGAMAKMLEKAPIHRGATPSRYAEGFGVRTAKPVQGPTPTMMDKVKGLADKGKGAWDKLPNWGKGMAAGGAGLGLLGGGMGIGAAMSSPDQQQPIIINK